MYLSFTLWVSKPILEVAEVFLRKQGISTCSEGDSPEPGAVEVYHHPLRRIKGERVGVLDARQESPELRAQKGCPSVSSIDMEPQTLTGT